MALVKPLKLISSGIFGVFASGDYVDPAMLGSGTPSASTVLAGNNTWASIATILGYTPVNKAGDTMSGPLVFSSLGEISRDADTDSLTVWGGSSGNPNASLLLYGGGNTGRFTLTAATTGSSAALTGTPAGALTWDGNAVWHAGNDGSGSGLDADTVDTYHVGTSGAAIPLLNAANTWGATQTFSVASAARRDVRNSWLHLQGGSGGALEDAALELDGGTYASGAGYFKLAAATSVSNYHILQGTPAGVLTWGANNLATSAGLVASSLGSGTVPTARLGSGTANGAAFLRGDQTWSNLLTHASDARIGVSANSGAVIAELTANNTTGYGYVGTTTNSPFVIATNGTDRVQVSGSGVWTWASTNMHNNLTAQYLGAVSQDAAFFRSASNLNAGTVAQARLGSVNTSWSPTIKGSGNGTAVSSQTVHAGYYAEIGDFVFFALDATINTVGSATGYARLDAPVTSAGIDTCGGSGYRGDSVYNVLGIAFYASADVMDIVQHDGTSTLVDGFRLRISGFYKK